MKNLLLAMFVLALFGCNDPDRVPRMVLDGFGATARADLAIHRRLRAIEKKLKIKPPVEDVEELNYLESEIEKAQRAKKG